MKAQAFAFKMRPRKEVLEVNYVSMSYDALDIVLLVVVILTFSSSALKGMNVQETIDVKSDSFPQMVLSDQLFPLTMIFISFYSLKRG